MEYYRILVIASVPLVVLLLVLRPSSGERPVVEVAQGRVRGVEVVSGGVSYYAFRGIPYAEPPTGELRFRDPVPAGPWEGDLDAALPRPGCPQSNYEGEEDCLILNVYVPKESISGAPLPVMAFIHGGAFFFGSLHNMDDVHALVAKGVIIVMMQYRLGVLGFLSTEDEVAPGNLGLKDQTLALRWIKDNIAAFGGDPDKVTIFGESAGGYSVHWQMMAPSAAGLFRGAIIQSGGALCAGAHGRNFLQVAQYIARQFSCPEAPSERLVSCLRTRDAHELAAMQSAVYEWGSQPRTLAPRVDGDFIPDEAVTLLKEGRYQHVPTIIGVTSHEGSRWSIDWYADEQIGQDLTQNFDLIGPISLELFEDEEPETTARKVFEYYLTELTLSKENADNATQLNSHRFWHIPLDWIVRLTSDFTPTFVYELQHRGQYGNIDRYLEQGVELPHAASWVSHADDLQYLFEWYWGSLETADDLAVRNVITTTWTNFAKTLNPTPDASLGFVWEATSASSPRHLKITPTPEMEENQRAAHMSFWDSLPLRENALMSGTRRREGDD